MAPASAAGADLLEADVHLRRGRLEIRHARSLGPLPWLWEPWYLVPGPALNLREVVEHLPERAHLMLDLKGWQPWLGQRVQAAMARLAPDQPYTVCTRHWRMLDVFRSLPHVRTVHSARTKGEFARLEVQLARHPGWGVSIHRDLLTAKRVAWLRERASIVMTWPIDTPEIYRAAVAMGVNAVISNDLVALRGL